MAANNVYTHMAFPPYEFREFPKWVAPPDGSQPVLCQNADEEFEAMHNQPLPSRDQVLAQADRIAELEAELSKLRGPVPEGIHGNITDAAEESERIRLLALADQRGVEVDRRWGVKKIKAALGM